MTDDTATTTTDKDESASNLRAIFEILSYIHVDAQEGSFDELSDRIGFALDCAEKLIKENPARSTSTDKGDTVPSLPDSQDQNTQPPTAI